MCHSVEWQNQLQLVLPIGTRFYKSREISNSKCFESFWVLNLSRLVVILGIFVCFLILTDISKSIILFIQNEKIYGTPIKYSLQLSKMQEINRNQGNIQFC